LAAFDESTPPLTYHRPESLTFRKTTEQWGGFSKMQPVCAAGQRDRDPHV
jgi:hypothetical protein